MATLYVTDLDGTLLLPDGTLGRRTLEVVNAFIASGGLLTYATGRSFHSANPILEGLKLHLPAITYAGAIIVDPIHGVAETAETIPVSAIEALLELFAEHELQPVLFSFQNGKDRVSWLDGTLSPGLELFLSRRRNDPRFMPVQSWKEVNLHTVFYISVIAQTDHLTFFRESLGESITDSCLTSFFQDNGAPGYHWLEFTSVLATKAHAAAKVQNLTGADSLVCFGDSQNDLSIFSVADEAYAVANSDPTLKSKATGIIGSNSDEAVAAWFVSKFF